MHSSSPLPDRIIECTSPTTSKHVKLSARIFNPGSPHSPLYQWPLVSHHSAPGPVGPQSSNVPMGSGHTDAETGSRSHKAKVTVGFSISSSTCCVAREHSLHTFGSRNDQFGMLEGFSALDRKLALRMKCRAVRCECRPPWPDHMICMHLSGLQICVATIA